MSVGNKNKTRQYSVTNSAVESTADLELSCTSVGKCLPVARPKPLDQLVLVCQILLHFLSHVEDGTIATEYNKLKII